MKSLRGRKEHLWEEDMIFFNVTIYLIQFVCISLKHKIVWNCAKMPFAFSQRAGAGGVLKCAVGRRSEIELNI